MAGQNRKRGADEGLAVEQFWDLDREFYNNYPREYFLNKMEDVLVRIAQPEKVSLALDGIDIKIGKLSAVFKQDDYQQVARYAKIELYETYVHCMESFFRLFLVRAYASGCDWLAITKLTISQYRDALEKIKDGHFDWIRDNMPEDLIVTYALTGIGKPDHKIEAEVIANWKSWISFCAFELSEVKAYNSYKHGLNIHASVGGFSLQPEGEDIEYGRKGDIISYLTRSEKEDRFVWVKKTEFIDLDDIAYKIYVFGMLICSMVETGQLQHGKTEPIERWYPPKEATPYFAHEGKSMDIQSIFQCVTSISAELLYYKDSDE